MSVNPRIPHQKFSPSFYRPEEALRPRCKDCGLKIRGANHKAGDDHLKRSDRK